MGFDILGLHPVDKDGEYFRNDIYSWKSLWDFVCEITGDLLTDKQKEMGSFNDGFKYNAKTSKAIAKKLKEALDSGAVKKYERKHKTRRKEPGVEPTEEELNAAFIAEIESMGYGAETGTAEGMIENREKGSKLAHKTRRKAPPGVNELCKVMGIKKERIVKDTFLEENVREFQRFCERCNGFEIC